MTPEQSRRCVRIAELYYCLFPIPNKENTMATIIHCAAEAEDLLKLEPVPGNEEYLSLRTQEGYSDTWDTEIRLDPTRRRQLAAALLDGLPEMDIITVAKPAGAPLPAGWEEVAS